MGRPRGPDIKNRLYPDATRHDQHWAWLRKKAQAHFRGESWSLTIEQWFELWDKSDQWDNRGRHKDSSAMFMRDPKLGWHVDNVEIVNRSDRLKEIHTRYDKPVVIKRKYTKRHEKWLK